MKIIIRTVKLMPGAITARSIVAGGIVNLGSSWGRSSCRQRNCRSAITCYWGKPRYGAFIAGASVAGTKLSPELLYWYRYCPWTFIVGAIISGALIARAIVVGVNFAGAIVAGVIVAGAFPEEA